MTKIGIIGSGIGGLGLAHYLGKQDKDYEITIFEREHRIGGRVESHKVDGYQIEVGAVYFHSANKLINDLVLELNLPRGTMDRQPIGLWNGSEFVFKQGKSEFWNNIKLLFRFGLTLTKLLKVIEFIKENVSKLYEEEFTFKTVDELLERIEFDQFAKQPIGKILSEKGLSDKLIAELIIPTSRYVYHHSGTEDMNGFAGLVSMIAYDDSPVHFVESGNERILEAIAEINDLNIELNAEVKSVSKTTDGVEIVTNGTTDEFDIAIIACPLSITDIELKNFESQPATDVGYKGYVKTIVVGELNPNYFNQKDVSKIPPMLLTNPTKEFPVYGFEKLGISGNNNPVYEITSTDDLPDGMVEEAFSNVVEKQSFKIPYSFPDLSVPEFYDPIILSDNCYYLSAADKISPTLETSLMMARNISKLIQENL